MPSGIALENYILSECAMFFNMSAQITCVFIAFVILVTRVTMMIFNL